jgi:hypothetical protein
LIGVFTADYSKVIEDGFFQGYNNTVWTVVSLQVFNSFLIRLVRESFKKKIFFGTRVIFLPNLKKNFLPKLHQVD